MQTLERTGLLHDLYDVGYRLAQTMVELFADLPPEHEYFSQFSFIAPEDLPTYRDPGVGANPGTVGRPLRHRPAAPAGTDVQADSRPGIGSA